MAKPVLVCSHKGCYAIVAKKGVPCADHGPKIAVARDDPAVSAWRKERDAERAQRQKDREAFLHRAQKELDATAAFRAAHGQGD